MADYGHPLNSSQSVSALDKSVVICAIKPAHFRNGSTGSSRHSRQNSRDWEVISDPECSAPVAGTSMAKTDDIFYIWLTKLTAHRHFKKNEAINLHHGVLQALSTRNGSTLPAMASLAQRNRVMIPHYQSSASLSGSETQGSPSASSSQGNSKVSDWLKQTEDDDLCHQELARCKLDLAELSSVIQKLHWHEGGLPITSTDLERRISMQSIPDYVYSQLSTPEVSSLEGKKLQMDICALCERGTLFNSF
ncbi:unnamed protein product [Leuciscus chuanchicus]